MWYVNLARLLPSVKPPDKRLTLKEKLKWTLAVLLIFYAMSSVVVYGVSRSSHAFTFYEVILGANIGTLMTLGIGPIVLASIILQMLVGSKIIPWDLRKSEDRAKYNAAQKLLAIFFCFFEAATYTLTGVFIVPESHSLIPLIILQLAIGGIVVIYLDEIVSKWGIGSGISLFIAAGISKRIIQRIFFPPFEGGEGLIFEIFSSLSQGMLFKAFFATLPIIATILIFAIVIYTQGIRVEFDITFQTPFGRVVTRKWPLRFFYTSNIPVILAVALINNFVLLGKIAGINGYSFIATLDREGHITGGIVYWLFMPPRNMLLSLCTLSALAVSIATAIIVASKVKRYVVRASIVAGIAGFAATYLLINVIYPAIESEGITLVLMPEDVVRALLYIIVLTIFSTVFSIFWVNTAGMDPKSIAEQFKIAALTLPGFRRDPRVIEKRLEKYIHPLAIVGGAFVGFLAGVAGITNALGTGTGILLTAMILMQFYELIMAQHIEDMHPGIREFFQK